MSDIKTRKYRCNGCGEDRPCYLTTNQEPHTLDYMQIDDLKCVLDETNQTSYNWEEVQANDVEYRADPALHKHIVINCPRCGGRSIEKSEHGMDWYCKPCKHHFNEGCL